SSQEQLYQCWESGNPYSTLPTFAKYWTEITSTKKDFWAAPASLFRICGQKAYSKLPEYWSGSCTLGAIQPNFFLLAKPAGNHLGVPL
ncbi:ENR1 protein, partial [Drymodes brunneopygia]|nr:ENR1 protein [Drymodes brunneopygia]